MLEKENVLKYIISINSITYNITISIRLFVHVSNHCFFSNLSTFCFACLTTSATTELIGMYFAIFFKNTAEARTLAKENVNHTNHIKKRSINAMRKRQKLRNREVLSRYNLDLIICKVRMYAYKYE